MKNLVILLVLMTNLFYYCQSDAGALVDALVTIPVPVPTTLEPDETSTSDGPDTTPVVTTTTVTPSSSTITPPTKPPVTTTEKPPEPTTTPTSTTTAPNPTKGPTPPVTTPAPSKDRHFDGPSFIGGIILATGLMAIGFVAFKFYKARTERNYHTL